MGIGAVVGAVSIDRELQQSGDHRNIDVRRAAFRNGATREDFRQSIVSPNESWRLRHALWS